MTGKRTLLAALLFAGIAGSQIGLAQTGSSGPASIPDLSGFWVHGVEQIIFHPLPSEGPGPVIDILNIECTPNCPPRRGGTPFIGDPSNPNLTERAEAAVRAMGERWRSGETVNVATELCAPSGVPHVLTLFGLVQFLQAPDQVTILYERDNQVRRIAMNRSHSNDPAPSWYGESVGHYEGDTLVVDTIGLNDLSLIDRFGVPQTEDTHVVERYRISNDRQSLVAQVTVDDPNMFHKPWSGTITYARRANAASIEEVRCAENNKDAATGADYPIPIAAIADF